MEICAPDDPRVQVDIAVPLRGGKTLALRVPRFEFMEETDHEAMTAALSKIDETPLAELSEHKRVRAAVLVMVKPFVSAKDYKTCETLTLGQLIGIRDHWIEQSNIPLGEYLASANSLTGNTEAPSNTTSTVEDGGAATSDAA